MELLDAPFERTFDARSEIDGVVLVRWPEDAARAVELAHVGAPRLFLVAAGEEPPETSDELCAWVRVPAHERDVQSRIVELRSRASVARPILGDHGVLWRGTRWVALSPIETRLTAAFVARPGRVLSRARLEKTGWPDGTPNDRSVDARSATQSDRRVKARIVWSAAACRRFYSRQLAAGGRSKLRP